MYKYNRRNNQLQADFYELKICIRVSSSAVFIKCFASTFPAAELLFATRNLLERLSLIVKVVRFF